MLRRPAVPAGSGRTVVGEYQLAGKLGRGTQRPSVPVPLPVPVPVPCACARASSSASASCTHSLPALFGTGGSGVVHKAIHVRKGHIVAVKIISVGSLPRGVVT